ncbi:protein disulfide oxidoreductase [Moraxella caviae]|uniref:Protein disulfide oxidoreductase n=1 Tax=Moraxella caviae TaxID=34060 RepID=A0A1T0A1U8_9GAMM|nr:protein disulfide oxidoreductase [Moraxella caviae]OOR89559.1 protein disulfide oxidoreductase [Moraxella caviae]STZ10238.1 Stage IV sporulation protein H [Moraxella caviae]
MTQAKPAHKVLSLLKNLLLYALMFLAIYTAVNFWRAPAAPAAPAFAITNADGQRTDLLAKSHDEAMLVYFWGTWCGVCRLTSPNVQALHADGQPVITVAVASGDDAELGAYLNAHGYTFATLNDDSGEMFRTWQGQVTPSFAIIKDGKAVQTFTGIAPLWSLRLRLWWANLA